MNVRKWIFVTGTPRSATTFVGQVLSIPLEVDYLHEPFNPDCGIPGWDQPFLYLRTDDEGSRYADMVARVFQYRFTLRTGYYPNDTRWRRIVKRFIGSRGPVHLRFAKWNPFHTTAVIKDPIGCLLTAYLAERFHVKPVVLIRHPVAFVASTLRLKWKLDLAPLLAQERLVQDYFADETDFLRRRYNGPVETGAALWRALNKVLLAQAAQHPDWITITHEEISETPLPAFQRLYRMLELPWSARVARSIRARTGGHNKAEAAAGRVQDFARDSSQLFALRMGMLTPAERRTVYTITRDVADQVYPASSFALD